MTLGSETEAPTVPAQADYYEVLNVPFGASKSLIRESYIRLKNAFSSHNNAFYSLVSEEEAQNMVASIEEAFRVLNDDVRRNVYNKEIGFEDNDHTNIEISAFSGGGVENPAGSFADAFAATQVEENKVFLSPTTKKTGPAMAAVDQKQLAKMEAIVSTGEVGNGEIFKQLREVAGVSEEGMQERTKICISYIRAIESNDFSSLPQAVFVKGFLRSYLKYLAAPHADKLVRAFAARHENWKNEKNKF